MMVLSRRQDISVLIPKVNTLDFTLNLRYFYTDSLKAAQCLSHMMNCYTITIQITISLHEQNNKLYIKELGL